MTSKIHGALFAIFAFCGYQSTAQVAPPAWVRVFHPRAAANNLKPFYPASAGISSGLPAILADGQNKISDAVVALSVPEQQDLWDYITDAPIRTYTGTGTFIVTDPSLNYVCLLTVGHNVITEDIAPFSGFVDLSEIAFNYRRNRKEQWGDDFATGVDYSSVSNLNLEVLRADVHKGIADFALIAVPKTAFPTGKIIYEAPYAFPTALAIPTTTAGELYMIHHAYAMPQRLSELTDAYNDVAKGHHYIMSPVDFPASRFTGLGDNFWMISNWSNGSFFSGTSGAALIRPTATGEPTVVGMLAVGDNYQDIYNRITTPAAYKVAAMKTTADADDGLWISGVYKLSNIKNLILSKCHTSEADALYGEAFVPKPRLNAKADRSFGTQAQLQVH